MRAQREGGESMAVYNRWIVTAALVATCFATGCESDKKDDKPRHHDRAAKHDPIDDRAPDPVIGHDRDRTGRRTGMDEIPADAKAVDTGAGGRLDYEPTRDGVIYVYDAD